MCSFAEKTHVSVSAGCSRGLGGNEMDGMASLLSDGTGVSVSGKALELSSTEPPGTETDLFCVMGMVQRAFDTIDHILLQTWLLKLRSL